MKPVLIIENSNQGLKVNENNNSKKDSRYLLEGIFTQFNEVNRNQRLYTAPEFVPHLDRMMEKKDWGVIYGEFDHPDVFDVSMKYVSHVIENAWYNEDSDRIDGEIRLLNTHWGKEAKSIVDDGCPLFVSSRAAGITESNGHVKLKQLFTYDIVADPGFSSARMKVKSLNESFGYEDSNLGLLEASRENLSLLQEKYDRSADRKIFDLSDEEKTNELFEMNKNDMVTKKQLKNYSVYLAKEIKSIQDELTNKITESANTKDIDTSVEKMTKYFDALQEQQDKVVSYLDYLAEKVSVSIEKTEKVSSKTDKVAEYSNYLAENLDKSIDYSNYIAENLDKSIDYSNYIAENLDKSIDYSNYIAENLDKSIDYSNYIAENLDKSIDYSNYIAENLDKSIDYSNYIAENLDANIGYANYLAENLDANIGYAEYVAENLDTAINYSEYVAECADQTLSYANMISEKLNSSKEGGLIKESFESADDFLKANKADKKAESLNESKNADKKANKKNKVEEINESAKSEMDNQIRDYIKENKGEENLSDKINTLIEEAKKREASKDKAPSFYSFLTTDDVKAFESLTNDEQETAKIAISESVGYYTRQDVLKLIHSALEKDEKSIEEKVLDQIPEDIKPIWESLDSVEKKSTLSASRLYDVSSDNLIEHFWRTRKFKKPLNESKTLIDSENPFEKNEKLSEDEIKMFTERFEGFN